MRLKKIASKPALCLMPLCGNPNVACLDISPLKQQFYRKRVSQLRNQPGSAKTHDLSLDKSQERQTTLTALELARTFISIEGTKGSKRREYS